MKVIRRIALGFLVAFSGIASANATELSGVATVVDGDTIVVGGTRIRLHGIDAPELKQPCRRWDGEEWACGMEAAKVLREYLSIRFVACEPLSKDRYGRTVARCTSGSEDVGRRLVRGGWALAYRRYSLDYVIDENLARIDSHGVWSGTFEMPWTWRYASRRPEHRTNQ